MFSKSRAGTFRWGAPDPEAVERERAAIDDAVRASIAQAECPWTGSASVRLGDEVRRVRWVVTEQASLLPGRAIVLAAGVEPDVWEVEWSADAGAGPAGRLGEPR